MSVIDTMPINRAERRRQHTREQLKQAALELLLEQGYPDLTIRAITERADLGYGTFYLYFPEKDDIVWALILDRAQAEEARINALLAGVPFPRREYLSWVELFRFADANRAAFVSMLGTGGSHTLAARYQDWLAAIHEANLRAGTYRADLDVPPDFLAQFLAGALMRLLVWWLETADGYTPEQMADLLYETAYRARPPREQRAAISG